MSFSNSLYHLVIRPKASKPVISEAYERDLYAYINGFCKNKGCSLYLMKAHPRMYPHFEGWGHEYFAVSYNYKDREMIRQYIMKQKEHHRRVSFKDELRALLVENGVEFKEEYL